MLPYSSFAAGNKQALIQTFVCVLLPEYDGKQKDVEEGAAARNANSNIWFS